MNWTPDVEGFLVDDSMRFEVGDLAPLLSTSPAAYLHDRALCGKKSDLSTLPCMTFVKDVEEAKAEAERRLA